MKNYILTGAPGSGKTVLIRHLEKSGYNVIEEAATDIIQQAQFEGDLNPWLKPDFIEKITQLQIQRWKSALGKTSPYQFFDRSPFCTVSLARYLGFAPSTMLLDEIERIKKEKCYEQPVFFIENLGFCEKTNARTLSFEECLRFEKIHKEVYLEHGLELIYIPKRPVEERAEMITSLLPL